MTSQKVFVYLSLEKKNVKVGTLWFHAKNGRERASFEYNKQWLKHSEKFSLDPALTLTEGSFHTGEGESLFGAIGDSAPDRWGRILMRRAEVARAKKEKVTPKTLLEIDYLLGVSDEARQGALRFSIEENEPLFLASKSKKTIPPIVYLPKLLAASERFIEENETTDDLKLLLAPGSSLGGARPKASIIDRDGSLSIAKFSKKDDEFNAVLWEAVALTLAKNALIKTPIWRVVDVLKKPVLIIKRFDRKKEKRIPFISAMSMLGAKDNEPHSYLEIVYALLEHGSSPNEDLAELWRRIVFSIMISNTDDHLRNHAFLYDTLKGWRLSPAYDINPTPLEIKPHVLTTAIDFEDTSASLDTALKVAKDFRLSRVEANKIIKTVRHSVKEWKDVALSLGISKKESERMSSAFRSDL